MLKTVITLLMVYLNISCYSQNKTDENFFSKLKFAFGISYFHLEYSLVRNEFLLNLPKDNHFIPSLNVSFQMNKTLNINVEMGMFGQRKTGALDSFTDIHSKTSTGFLGSSINYKLKLFKCLPLKFNLGFIYINTRIFSQNDPNNSSTIFIFEDSRIRQFLYTTGVIVGIPLSPSKNQNFKLDLSLNYDFALNNSRWFAGGFNYDLTSSRPFVRQSGPRIGLFFYPF